MAHIPRHQRWPVAIGLSALTGIITIVAVVLGTRSDKKPLPGLPQRAAIAAGSCGLAAPVFCDTFDQPMGTGNRSGALDGTVWGVSRANGTENYSGPFNPAYPSQKRPCGVTPPVLPPRDIQICNGQLQETMNDGGTVAVLALYPKQPFDFAGRTGKITFDVGNDSQGNHAAWPELWVTNRPVPAPFSHEATWQALPEQGFGVRFAGFTDANGTAATCPEGAGYVGVDSAIVITASVENDSFNAGTIKVIGADCVKQPQAAGQLNHYEVDVSSTNIDVFGTDAGTTAPLKHLATINNFGTLGFSRGLVWIEDAHYNGDKFNAQTDHAFTWDNVGFDGPFTYLDLTYDVLDRTGSVNGDGSQNLGWFLGGNATQSWQTLPVDGAAIPRATAAYVLLNFWSQSAGFTLQYSLNGHAHTLAWPYPDMLTFTWRTLALPVALSDVVAGPNTITVTTGNYGLIVANLDVLLVAAGGAGTPTPTPSPTPTRSPTPSPSATPAPTPAPSPTPSPAASCSITTVSGGTVTIQTNGRPQCTVTVQ